MAREDQLGWATLEDMTHAARAFLDPVLAEVVDATWDSGRWSWSG